MRPLTINQNRDFLRIYRTATPFVYPELVVYVRKRKTGACRLGITAGKKVGGAVKRNRAKRVIREAFRRVCENLRAADIVIVARARTPKIKSTALEGVLKSAFKKAGILAAENEKTV